MRFSKETIHPQALSEQAVWLALEPHPVLAFLHAPAAVAEGSAAASPAAAVLLCPTFGWEEICSYRGRRVWAQTLARAGFPAARFSLPGAGDSGGSPRDSGLLEAWTNATAHVAAWLGGATGAERIAAVGVGLGGMLACRAVAAGAPIDDLILWAAPARGSSWLREQRAYARLVASHYAEDRRPEMDGERELEYIGYVLTEETAAAVSTLRLTELQVPESAGRRVLLLSRDGIAPDEALREHFERAGAEVSVLDGEGYASFTQHPQEARPPTETIATTIEWLSKASGPRPLRAPFSGGDRVARSSVTLSWRGASLREAPLSLDGPDGEIFAVLSARAEAERAPVCAVWLNGGALGHTGPNRAWVEAARRWASRGVPTVRVDLPGIGDSDGEEGCVSNPDLYTPARTRDTLAIVDQLARRGLADRFVLGGLCSGAYWSLHAALADERVAGLLLINPYAFFWSAELVAERDTAGSLMALHSSRRLSLLARGGVSLGRMREIASALRPTRMWASAGHPVERAQRERIEAVLDQLRNQRTQTLLLFSRGEGLHDQLRRQGVLGRLDRWPNLTVERIPSADHMFRALWLQRHVHESLDRALERVLDLVARR